MNQVMWLRPANQQLAMGEEASPYLCGVCEAWNFYKQQYKGLPGMLVAAAGLKAAAAGRRTQNDHQKWIRSAAKGSVWFSFPFVRLPKQRPNESFAGWISGYLWKPAAEAGRGWEEWRGYAKGVISFIVNWHFWVLQSEYRCDKYSNRCRYQLANLILLHVWCGSRNFDRRYMQWLSQITIKICNKIDKV